VVTFFASAAFFGARLRLATFRHICLKRQSRWAMGSVSKKQSVGFITKQAASEPLSIKMVRMEKICF
tara:strand:- start:33 stop:233 length:201 start_codon:yes stop_codon:yes gene_type:complete